jgi:hypothetical protein
MGTTRSFISFPSALFWIGGGSERILKEVLAQVKTEWSSADCADYADFFTTTKY